MNAMTIYSIRTKILLLTIMLIVNVRGVLAATFVGQVFYEQNYEATGVVADWTTSVNERFTPTILTESGNHFMAANPEQTFNNGATLTGPNINVGTTEKFVMTFDLRLRKSSYNDNRPEFYITNYTGNKFFSLKAGDGIGNTTWVVNDATNITLTGTEYANNSIVSDLHWFRFKLVWDGTNMKLEITDKGTDFASSTSVLASTTITRLNTDGGIGNMVFSTGRSLAKFALDNIHVTSLFSFSSDEAAIDITSIGMNDRPDVSDMLPSLINEISGAVTETTYSSSDWNVARVVDGAIYLIGVGTTSIGIKKTIGGNDYKSNYELTVYGSQATVTKTVTDNAGTTTATWFLNGDATHNNAGLVEQSYDFGVVTLTTSYGSETAISVKDLNDHYVVRVIRSDNTLPGSTATNTTGSTSTLHEDNSGGTFYRIDLAQRGTLQIWGTGGQSAILLNALTTSSTVAANTTDTGTGSSTWNNLSAGTYYLYNTSLHRITYTYTTPKIAWSDNLTTVNINDVGITNPNIVTGLPTLTKGNGDVKTTQTGTDGAGVEWHNGYGSSNPSVAIFQGNGSVLLKSTGTTIMKVLHQDGEIDGSGNVNDEANIAAYKLVVTGNTVTHTISNGNTMLSFDDEGVIGTGQQTAALTNLTVTYGYTGENSIVTEYNGMKLLKVIDANGYSHPNLTGNGEGGQPPSTIPWEGAAGGTFLKLNATADGYLIVKGNVNSEITRVYKWGTTTTTPQQLIPEFDEENNTMSVTLGTNESGDNYYLYNTKPDPDDGTYIPPVHSISFVPAFFQNSYETVAFNNINTYTIQVARGFDTPTYTIVETKGDVYDGEHAIGIDGSNHLTNVAGGGAIRIRATKEAKSIDYILTVAYPASAYPGKLWNFNDGSSIHSITAVPTPTTTSGDWTARYKNASRERDARWFYQNAVAGDNAFIVEKTAGLIFETAANSFYMRNDDDLWRHIGFARRGASFTIPLLKAGDIVELNWKRDAETSGGTFTATNVTDLRGKTVSEQFVITGSRNRDTKDLGGWTSFIVTSDGNVKFTLEDTGYNDLLSVRIYNGGYHPTMDPINQYDGGNGVPAPTSILLDRAEQSVTLNYSNPLHGTATGPAMYVLKGYRSGVDPEECVKGKDSQKPGNPFVDEDGYPVSSDEKAELYAQRQYLTDFHMYNESWESANNTYNNGVISASGGYGKVTVRLNNYTQDMKYVIGYTPDYTITFGSAPHQTYPYTWNFTNISGGAVHDNSDNAYNNVSKDYDTWANLGNYRFGLYTDTGNGSYYVPGATLVAKGRELNRDEFAGLGFTGGLYFQTADGTTETVDPIPGEGVYTLLTYTLLDSENEEIRNWDKDPDGTGNNAGYWTAGNGYVKFGSTSKRAKSNVAAGGAAYQMDGGGSKHILLKPKRAFRNGDVITFKGYYTAAAACTGSNYGMSFRNEASQSVPYLAAVFIPAGTAKDTEVTLTYTVTRGDGIAGLSEVYVFRANSTTFLTAVTVTTTDHTAGANYGKRITASSSEPLVITIPDLNAASKQDYIYIESSRAPSDITNATAAVAADGLDAAAGVFKYKVTAPGNCEVTFDENTTINCIGVTHILKPLTTVGEGASAKGWATESRNCAIDHNLTGVFTLNDVKAKYATVDYDVQKAIVTLKNIGSYGVPASTGLVLKMEDVTNLSKANSLGVPLFAPAISTSTLTAANIAFNGPMGNAMQPNLTERIFTEERENANGTDNASGTFTRFILATKFMKWKKIGDADVTHDVNFTDGNVPVFYRMHIYTDEEASAMTPAQTTDALNTLGANKAYLSLHTANLPDALWKVPSSAKPFIPILGESDMEEIIEGNNGVEGNSLNNGTYNLSGQRVNDNGMLPPGIYIKNGKKILVK